MKTINYKFSVRFLIVLFSIFYFLFSSHALAQVSWGCIANDGVLACAPSLTVCQSLTACQPQAKPQSNCAQYQAAWCGKLIGTAPPANIPSNFQINPPSRFKDAIQLINAITGYILALSIPLATIMIIYAGVRFLTARGNPSQVSRATEILKLAVIGLAIILIGKGFISLIASILQ